MKTVELKNEAIKQLNDRWGHEVDLYFESEVANLQNRLYKIRMMGLEIEQEKLSDGLLAYRSGNKVKICSEGRISPGKKAFADSYFHSIHTQGLDTSRMKDMSYLFRQSYIDILDLSGFQTSNAGTMQGMFMGCQAEKMDLTSFDTSNVTNMVGMFCLATVHELDLSCFDTRKVTSMRQMFKALGCSGKLDLSGFSITEGTSLEKMFEHICVETEPIITDPILNCEWERTGEVGRLKKLISGFGVDVK